MFTSFLQSQPKQVKSTHLLTESPNLLIAKLLGGSGFEAAWGQAAGPDGSFFVTGLTESTDFPDVAGYSEGLSGSGDAFLVKINPYGTLDYATYIGGSGVEDGYGLAINQSGEAYMNGFTYSSDFPTTPDAVSTTPSGSFLIKLSTDGSQLLYSSYIGDSNTRLIGLVIDENEDIYMLDGGYGNGTAYKLQIGSENYEYVHPLESGNWWGIDIDDNGYAYFSGFTQTSPYYDVLAAAINDIGEAIYSFSFGGSQSQRAWSVAVDSEGYAYITGDTNSTDFPMLGDQITPAQPQDAFVTIINPSGSIVYSSYLNLNSSESGGAIAVDDQDTLYVIGTTDSIDFPLTAGAVWNPGENGYWYAFVVKLKTLIPRASYQIEYATPIGGSDWDFTYSFTGTVDENGYVYVTGETESPDFIGTEGVSPGDTQAFAVKVSTEAVGAIPDVFIPSTYNSGDNKTTIQGVIESDGTISSISCSTQGTCGDPINTNTGVFSFTLADMSFPTSAGSLVFQRSYSTGVSDNAGTLGYGWTHNHDAKLIFPTDPGGVENYVLFQSVLGNQFQFNIEADGSFTPGPGVIATLTKSATTPVTYTLTDSQQAVFQFDENGLLTLRKDAQGHEFDYTYDSQGKLTDISTDNGARFIHIQYDGQDRIETVSNHASQQVIYGYDTSGNLVSFIDVLGQTWTYLYDSGHRMTQANDPAGKETVRTEYDAQGRANNQYDGEGNLIVSITYNTDGTTIVYDALGSTIEHQYDEHHIAFQTVDAVGRTETKEFNSNLRPTTITNDANQTLSMTWSADGVNLESKIDPEGNQTDYTYDSLNNLTSTTDSLNNTTNYTYNGTLLTSSTDALNGVTSYTYTPEGFLETTTDMAGRVTSYIYDSFGQRVSMTDPSNNTWTYTYDDLGRLIDTTDPRGRTTRNEYNAAGKLIRVTQNYDAARPQNDQDLYNIMTEYAYDVRGNQIAVTDTFGRTTQYVYDDADRLLQTIDPAGNTTTNTYDAAGRLISTKDPLLNETTYEYDAAGRLIKTTNALGYHSGTTTFDVAINTSTVTDILGRQTVFHYDELGRVVQVVDPLENSTTTTYDPNGNVATRTDQLGRTTTYQYDELNRLVSTTDPNTGVTQTVYDPVTGYRTATIDPLGNQTTYAYDSVGRLISTTDPLGRVTQTVYDSYGRRSATIDAAGNQTTYVYDLLDRVIEVHDPADNITYTTYDALGNVLTRTDANGNTTTSTYDVLNRPYITTDANGNSTTNAYDAAGNLVSVTDALGKITTYTYDALNRPVVITDPLGHTTQSIYDSLGNLLETVNANGVVTHYEFDALNRQTAVILNYQPGVQPDAETNIRYEFGYNEVGNRVSVTDPNGNETTYGYDAFNRVTSKVDPLTNTWSYIYDLAGNRTSATDAKNQTIIYIYDDADQLTNIDYPGTEPDVSFTYTLTGQRATMTDGLGTTTWTYDNLDRPITVDDALGNTISYAYDAVGNRTELVYPDNKTVTYTYDVVNQLTSVNDWDNQDTDYLYDDIGRVTTVSLPNGVDSEYTYDDGNRLKEMEHVKGSSVLASYNYSYDPAGNRTQAIELLQNPPELASLNTNVAPVAHSLPTYNNMPASYHPLSYQAPEAQIAQNDFRPQQQISFGQLPLYFVPNLGQFDKDVDFQTNALGGSIFFTESEVVLALMDKKIKLKNEESDTEISTKDNSKVVRIEYKGADKKPLVEGIDLLSGTANFMVGADASKWVSNAPTYAGIVYHDLYPGVDLRYEGSGRSLKSTFTVATGTDPSVIQWRYKQAGEITLNENGDLLITLPAKKSNQTDTTLIEHAPLAWQDVDGQRVDVPVEYALANNGEISFIFSEGYNTSLPLIIDPTLTYSTYLGDIGTDVGTAITTDSSGNVYVTGYSWCGNFPTVDPITGVTNGNAETIISKISADGSALLYSTCVGGAGDDFGKSIDLDSQGRIVVAGETNSTDFPIVSGISTYGGGSCSSGAPCQDTFILALNSDGSAIRYSTYLGGNGREEVGGIAADGDDNIVVVGSTTSTNYPTQNAYDTTFGGGSCSGSWPCYDVTVTKIDPDLSGTSAILYSTYLGSNKRDKGYGLVLDANGNIYLAGYSDADGYPTRNALQSSRSGSVDIIISQIDPFQVGDASLIYSTYLGSTGAENGYAIARDADGNLYITGRTSSPRFPLRDPLQYESHPGTCDTNCYEAFVTKLDITTNTILYSTYLGGSENDEGNGIAVDTSGRAYVTGFTRSSDFPTLDAIQPTKGGDGCSSTPCKDAFLSVIEPDGQSFAYSTFLGGDQDDEAKGITLDGANNVYIVGETYSTNYPTTAGAYDVINTETNKRDAFISKIGALGAASPPTTTHFDIPIAAGDDDAEEKSSGYVSLDSNDLELVYDGSNQHVGLRFTGVEIPQGATITAAWIQFTVNEATSDTTSLIVQAQAADDPSTFTSSSGNISSRPTTSASVPWIPPVWDTVDVGGPDQRTPDLAYVVQEVVDRQGWIEGNPLVFIITGTGERVAKSYERDVYGAPYLHVEYTEAEEPPPTTQLTIDYTYDALKRIKTATYDDGRTFTYTYDAAGNVLELGQNLGSGTVTTTYTYNAANELVTATVNGTTWNYTYDANGSLIEVLPNGSPDNGAKRYTYNVAGNLVQVEAHNGSNWDVQAEMDYNGLGQRLSMTAAGVTSQYVMDGDRPLTAESNGNTTFYLYGLGGIGEKTTDWSYSLPDGTNTPRQLSDINGDITLTSRYTPWGDTLDTYGTGNFSFGYLGGVLDATTGLLYVGNGQYYDPATGRFLTRNVNPNSTNPYVPWNPIGAILGPLGLIALVFGKRKKGSKAGTFLVLLLVIVTVGMTLTACGGNPQVQPGQVTIDITTTPNYHQIVVVQDGTVVGITQVPTSTPIPLIVATACATPNATLTPTQTPSPTSDPTFLPLPDINDIPDLEGFISTANKEKTISRYKEMRKALYEQDHMYIESGTGKIRDDVLVAMIISAELGVLKSLYPNMYPETLEALSNQYDSGRRLNFNITGNMICYGSCTIKSQITWLYDMEGIRADSFVQDKIKSRLWLAYLPDAQSVVNGYTYGENASWFWGNVTKEELCQYVVVNQVYAPELYPGAPYFIVQSGRTECK
ncbi:MAG TPA: SBBP repeat-containing protein [Anaerolineales bacterium]|nr:SBBP repeat-containing protein [Anaerolineales bacterium]